AQSALEALAAHQAQRDRLLRDRGARRTPVGWAFKTYRGVNRIRTLAGSCVDRLVDDQLAALLGLELESRDESELLFAPAIAGGGGEAHLQPLASGPIEHRALQRPWYRSAGVEALPGDILQPPFAIALAHPDVGDE